MTLSVETRSHAWSNELIQCVYTVVMTVIKYLFHIVKHNGTPSIKCRVEAELHPFLNSALDWGEWWASLPGRFIPTERAYGTHWRMLYFNILRSSDSAGGIITRLGVGRIAVWVGSIRYICEIQTHVKIVMRPKEAEAMLGWGNWWGRPGNMNILSEKIWFSALNKF